MCSCNDCRPRVSSGDRWDSCARGNRSRLPLSCSSDNTWEHGNSLINYMKMADINGLTGRIKFDENGLRTDFELEIVELKKHGLEKVS